MSNTGGREESAEKICRTKGRIFFEQLNVDERREADISTLGIEVRGIRRVPESPEVRVEEVRDVIERMNSGKLPDMDGVEVEILKVGKEVVGE